MRVRHDQRFRMLRQGRRLTNVSSHYRPERSFNGRRLPRCPRGRKGRVRRRGRKSQMRLVEIMLTDLLR